MIPLDGSVVKKIKPVGKRAELCLMIVVIPHVVQGHGVLPQMLLLKAIRRKTRSGLCFAQGQPDCKESYLGCAAPPVQDHLRRQIQLLPHVTNGCDVQSYKSYTGVQIHSKPSKVIKKPVSRAHNNGYTRVETPCCQNSSNY